MLTVAKVTSRDAIGYAEYLEGKARASELGDYYLKAGERVEAPGRWVTGAEHVSGDRGQAVTSEQLHALMSVRHPGTGAPLRLAGGSGQAVAALDATFSAPKSVSAVWALGDAELRVKLEAAHERAVDRAVRYSITEVPMIRQRLDRQTVAHAKAVDLVATSWRHTTARAVDGRPPEPQLHSHVLLHAAVRGDGKLVAIDSRSWLLHRRELGAAYRTELARELSGLGFAIERGTGRGGRYFEIAGVPQELLDRWSSRHHQVQEAIQQRQAAKHGARLTPAEERLAALGSRAAKQPVTVRDLDRDWQQTAVEQGFAPGAVRGLRDSSRSAPEVAQVPELVGALTEFDATFTGRQARAVALERSTGTSIEDATGVLDQARADGQVLELANGRHTTWRHRAAEHAVIGTAGRLAEAQAPEIHRDAVVDAALLVGSRFSERDQALSAEQVAALAVAAGSRQTVMIEGQAGTGKSTVLQAVALAHHNDGRQVIVTSTAAVAAERLAGDLAQVGVTAPAYSTAALQHAINEQQIQLGPDTTVIHDEAAIASTREHQQLLKVIEDSGARLVTVGDPKQSKPVGAAGLWPQLQQIAEQHDNRAELTHNLRAQDPADRRDQQLFREGHHLQAVRGYADRDRIHHGQDQAAAEAGALRAAQIDRRYGNRTIVIAQTSNDHLDELNARAQHLRHRAGELGADSLPVPGRPYEIHPGDPVQIRRTLNHPERHLRNGTTATISDIDPDAQIAAIRLEDGAELLLDREQLQKADIRLAYVQHPLPAQGITTDTSHVIVGDQTTKEGTYVAITRSRQTSHIHAARDTAGDDPEHDPLAALAARLSRTEPDVPSIATPLAHEQQIEQETGAEREATAERKVEAPEPEPETATERNSRRPRWLDLISERQQVRDGAIHAREAASHERDDDGWEM